MDRSVNVRSADMEALQRFRAVEPLGMLQPGAVERAREFQQRAFGNRILMPSSAELIEEARRERTEELP